MDTGKQQSLAHTCHKNRQAFCSELKKYANKKNICAKHRGHAIRSTRRKVDEGRA